MTHQLRIDLHLHSSYSSDSATSLPDLVHRCREVGLDRIALTDHNTAEGALKLAADHPELAIVAEEVRTTEGEIIGLFITETIHSRQKPEAVLELIHQMGGLTYLAHPFDRQRASFDPRRVVELAQHIDIIETYNPWSDEAANQAAERMAADLDKAAAWGSDAHGTSELGLSWMEIEPYDHPADFLAKLRRARFGRTPQSGRIRRR